eukprot:COSAG01_NODE_1003_length_12216_cov_8.565350_11_plen_123_part_00
MTRAAVMCAWHVCVYPLAPHPILLLAVIAVTRSTLTETDVTDVKGVMRVMELGTKNRAASATKMNEQSSRSHCVLMVQVLGVSEHAEQSEAGRQSALQTASSQRPRPPGSSITHTAQRRADC